MLAFQHLYLRINVLNNLTYFMRVYLFGDIFNDDHLNHLSLDCKLSHDGIRIEDLTDISVFVEVEHVLEYDLLDVGVLEADREKTIVEILTDSEDSFRMRELD